MLLTKNDIRYIINESAKRLLNEISVKDAYARFYSDIPRTSYNLIVGKLSHATLDYNSENTLHPDAKWFLNLYRKMGIDIIEDIYKLRTSRGDGYLDIFERLKKRRMISGEDADLNKYKSVAELGKFVNSFNFEKIMGRTKGEMSNVVNAAAGDIEVPYEDNEWKIVIPKSYEASCYWGKGTEWCTATRETDEYYETYTKRGPLYININKINGHKYQFHFETNQFMDAEDIEIDFPIFDEIGASKGMKKFYKSIVPKPLLMNMSYYPLDNGKRWEIRNENGLCNIIDENENVLSEIWFDSIDDYYQGVSKVKKDGKVNYITMNGNLLSKQWFDVGSVFSRGWAGVGIFTNDGEPVWNVLMEDGSLGCNFMWFDKIYDMYYRAAKCEKEGIILNLFPDEVLVGGNRDYRVRIKSYEDFKKYRKNIFQEYNKIKDEYLKSIYYDLKSGNQDFIPNINNNYNLDTLRHNLGIVKYYDIKEEDYT